MRKILTCLVAFALVSGLLYGAPGPAQAEPPATPYPVAAPLDSYLIPAPASEVELARSAAPSVIANGAEILVLGSDGYKTAVKGDNGFVCLVERSWGKDTADPEFWNPKIRAPICVNAAAARTYLPLVMLKARLAMAGKSAAEIGQSIKTALENKEVPPLEPNAMCYMMSRQQYLSDDDVHWHPHLMWFVPGDARQSWGANQPGVPVLAGYVPEDRMTIFLLPVAKWSDGTSAMPPMH